MADKLRFHLDESVDPDIAHALGRHGIDVTTTGDADLRGHTDVAQLSFAQRECRVLLTHDADFLRLANSGAAHRGIVYCSQRSRSLGQMIRSMILIWEVLTPDEIAGRIEFL